MELQSFLEAFTQLPPQQQQQLAAELKIGPVFNRTLRAVAQLTQNEFEMIIDRGILSHYNMHLMLSEKRALFIGPIKEELCRSWILNTLRVAGEKAFVPIPGR